MPPKPSNPAWKTGEQLEFLLSNWEGFKHAQNAKKLDHFWQRVFEAWYKRWPITPPPSSHSHEPIENQRLMAQRENNTRIKSWFNNRCRGTEPGKMGRAELKLDINEKRRLAPVQAYCAYAWESTLRNIVLARWEQQKSSATFDDDEDPPEDADGPPGASHIPLPFKLKIAREMYDQLPADEKQAINARREEDRQKLYRTVPEIEEEKDRIAKLELHKKNQSCAPKSLLRVLKNLEDQTGCVAQLLIASVDPGDGIIGIQKFCHGRTEVGGLAFEEHYGKDWEENVIQKFGEWAVRIFGDVGSKRREIFTLPKTPTTSGESVDGTSTVSPSSARLLSPSTPATSSVQSISPPTSAPPSRKSAPQPAAPKKARSRPYPLNPLPKPSVLEKSTPQPPSFHAPSPTTAQPTGISKELQFAPVSVPPVPNAAVNSVPSVGALGPNVGDDVTPVATAHQPLSQAVIPPQVAQPPSMSSSEGPETAEITQLVAEPSQLVSDQSQADADPLQLAVNPLLLIVNPSHPPTSPQVVVGLSQSLPQSPRIPTEATIQSGLGATPIPPQLAAGATPVTTAGSALQVRYRARDPEAAGSTISSRRGSIDGAPDITVNLHANSGISSHPDPTIYNGTPEVVVDLSDYVDMASDTEEESHVSSSQKTSDGCRDLLSPPPSSQWRHSGSGKGEGVSSRSQSPTHNHALLDIEDLPSWLTKKGQWKYVASTAGGPAWERLLEVYMQQERRLEFTDRGATLTHEGRPSKIKEYFQYAHLPSRGDSLAVPDFGEEVAAWWKTIQPEWRRIAQDPPQSRTAWSYILSGGSKGVFLVLMCLAWWDRAHTRYLGKVKDSRQAGAGTAEVTASFPDHDAKWLEIVEDVTLVMEKAQDCNIPGMPSSSRGAKRKREQEPAASRKKSANKRSTAGPTSSRTRSKA